MIFLISLYIAPLLPLPIAMLVHGGSNWRGWRIPLIFSLSYMVLLASGFFFVWYCYVAGYEDWIIANIVPQVTGFLGFPASWIAFIWSLRDSSSLARPTENSVSQEDVSG